MKNIFYLLSSNLLTVNTKMVTAIKNSDDQAPTSTKFLFIKEINMLKKIICFLFLLPTFSLASSLNSDYMFGLRSKNFKVSKANTILKSLNNLNIVSCPQVAGYKEFVDCLVEVHQFDCSKYKEESKFFVDNVKLECSLYSLLLKIMYASVTGEIYLNLPESPAPDFPKNKPNKILNWALGVNFILELNETARITD